MIQRDLRDYILIAVQSSPRLSIARLLASVAEEYGTTISHDEVAIVVRALVHDRLITNVDGRLEPTRGAPR